MVQSGWCLGIRGFPTAVVALGLLSCRGDDASPGPVESTAQALQAPASSVGAAGGKPTTGAPPDTGSAGVIVRLKGPSAFEAHGKARGGGRVAAQAAGQAQRRVNRAQHARLVDQLARQLGGLPARRGHHKVVGPSHETFTDALNAIALHGVDENTARRLLQGQADVVSIEPIEEVHASLTDSVPLIDADDLWSMPDGNGIAMDGTGMRIGIVDTGVDYSHPDLGGCFGPGCKVSGGFDFVNHDDDPMDDNGHGTHVAATAAGAGSYAGSGGPAPLRGVAPAAQIYAYKVLDSSGSGWNTDIIAAIERCADPNDDGDPSDHLDVCNLSLGGGGNPDDATSTAVDNATAGGVVFAISAGNGGPGAQTIGSPGTARQAITVAAACKPSSIGVDSRCAQAVASFSSRGPVVWNTSSGTQTLAKPDVAAPGVTICAAEWGTYQSGSRCLDSTHIAISGTSMASPHVAGVAALLRQAHPEWSPAQVKSFIMSSATDLGLDASTQGAGMIDALHALTLGGIPSSFARITGTPLLDQDVPTTRFASFSSAITVTNTSTQSLTFAASFAGDAGLTAELVPASLTLDPGASGSITITRQIDHDLVASGTHATGTITLTTALGEAHVGLRVGVRDRLVAQPGTADLGVDLASQASWTGQTSVQLTNLRADAAATYSASIECCNSATQTGGTNITASLDRTTLTIDAGSSANLGITVQVNNAPFSNGRFQGTLILSSTLGTIRVPVTFFKGYGIQLDVAPPLPFEMTLSSAQSGSSVIYPVTSSSMTFLSTTPGPFFAEAMWQNDGKYQAYLVVAGPLETDVPIRTATLDKAQAIHTIELRPIDRNGAVSANANFLSRVLYPASAGGTSMLLWAYSASGKFRTSPIPAGLKFTAVGMARGDDYHAYFYEVPGPIAEDRLLTNAPEDLVAKEIRSFRSVSDGNTPYVEPLICLPSPYASQGGAMIGGGTECVFLNNFTVPLSSGVTGMYVANNTNRDLLASPYPDAAAIRFVLLDGSPSGAIVHKSPAYHVTADHTYVWEPIAPYANTTSPAEAYSRFGCDEPAADILPLGPGPLLDQWAWYNRGTSQLSFRLWRGQVGPVFAWNGCWDSYADEAATYRLYRGGELVTSGSLNGYTLYPAPAVGDYRIEVTRSAVVANTTVTVESVGTFTATTDGTRDENPPRLRGLHLVGRGLWQDVFDVGTVNRLRFSLDPVPGLAGLNPTPPPLYTEMPDALASVTLQQSTDGIDWVAVPVTRLGAGDYVSDELYLLTSASLVWLRISAADLAGNTFRYTFQIPRGSGYTASGADTTPPTTAITAPADGAEVDGQVTVTAIAADDAAVARVDLLVDGIKVASTSTAPYTFVWNSSTVGLGSHQLQTRAVDAGENVGESAPISVMVTATDTTPPVVSFVAPAPSAFVRGTVAVQAQASDDNLLTRVDFYDGTSLLGSDVSPPYGASWTPAAEGAHTLRAVAYDGAGNSASATLDVTVDNSAPTVALTSPPAGSAVGATVTVAANASDTFGIARVEFYDGVALIGSDASAPYALPHTFATDGIHTIRAVAIDNAGNSASARLNVIVDNIPPTVALTAPSPGSTVRGTVNVTADASDASGVNRVEFYDGSTLIGRDFTSPYSVSWTPTTDGTHTLRAIAVDGQLNPATASVEVTVDNSAPVVALTAPAAGTTVGGQVSITATASDASGIVRVEFYDGATLIGTDTSAPYEVSWTSSADGPHTLAAVAYDAAGNSGTATLSVVVDNTAPAVALTAPAAGATVSGNVSVTASATDTVGVTRVDFYRDGTVLLGTVTAPPYSITWDTTSTAPGTHTLSAVAFDGAGHSTTSASRGVTVSDSTAPTVAITSPVAGTRVRVGSTVTITATASDVSGVSKVLFYVGGTLKCTDTTAPYSCAWKVPSGAGKTYTLQAKAYDVPGNSRMSSSVSVISQ